MFSNSQDGQSLISAHYVFQLQIWDTAGQERFRSITQSYYRSANALILTYDITCEDSFRCLPEWLREIEQYANNQVVTILVGKKLYLYIYIYNILLYNNWWTSFITRLIVHCEKTVNNNVHYILLELAWFSEPT